MKKLVQSAWIVGALVALPSIGMALSAQDTAPSQSTDQQAQQPATPPPSQAPATQDQQPASSSPQQAQPGSQMDQSAPPAQAQQPAQPPQTTPDSSGQRPDAQAGSTPTSAAQSFTGTIVKSGDKYKFQDAASGNTYDIDHQDEVSKYEGKKVKVHGTLDGNTIHLQ